MDSEEEGAESCTKLKRTRTSMVVKESSEELDARKDYLEGKKLFKDFSSELKCTKCATDLSIRIKNGEELVLHPLLKVLYCRKCEKYYGDDEFSLDEDGEDKYCRWCGEGGKLFLCSKCICGFCPKCIKINLGKAVLKQVKENDDWQCFICLPKPLWPLRHVAHLANKTALENKKKIKKEREQKLANMTVKAPRRVLIRASESTDDSETEAKSKKDDTAKKEKLSKNAKIVDTKRKKSSDSEDIHKEKKSSYKDKMEVDKMKNGMESKDKRKKKKSNEYSTESEDHSDDESEQPKKKYSKKSSSSTLKTIRETSKNNVDEKKSKKSTHDYSTETEVDSTAEEGKRKQPGEKTTSLSSSKAKAKAKERSPSTDSEIGEGFSAAITSTPAPKVSSDEKGKISPKKVEESHEKEELSADDLKELEKMKEELSGVDTLLSAYVRAISEFLKRLPQVKNKEDLVRIRRDVGIFYYSIQKLSSTFAKRNGQSQGEKSDVCIPDEAINLERDLIEGINTDKVTIGTQSVSSTADIFEQPTIEKIVTDVNAKRDGPVKSDSSDSKAVEKTALNNETSSEKDEEDCIRVQDEIENSTDPLALMESVCEKARKELESKSCSQSDKDPLEIPSPLSQNDCANNTADDRMSTVDSDKTDVEAKERVLASSEDSDCKVSPKSDESDGKKRPRSERKTRRKTRRERARKDRKRNKTERDEIDRLTDLKALERRKIKRAEEESDDDDDVVECRPVKAVKEKMKEKEREESLLDLQHASESSSAEKTDADNDDDENKEQEGETVGGSLPNFCSNEANKILKSFVLNSSSSEPSDGEPEQNHKPEQKEEEEEEEKIKSDDEKIKVSKRMRKKNSGSSDEEVVGKKMKKKKISDDDDESEGSERPKSDSSEEDEEEEEEIIGKRDRKAQVVSDSDSDFKLDKDEMSDSENDDQEPGPSRKRRKNKSDSSNSDGDGEEKKPKWKRIAKDLDDDSSSDSDVAVLSQKSQKGRRNIKQLMKKDALQVETKQAVRAEEERRARIAKRKKEFAKLFPDENGRLILDFDENGEVLVEVARRLVKKLKPHQKEGVRFMWDNCFESLKAMETSNGGGCILAHCMGLGKTLQVIALLHTVLAADIGVTTAMVICPLNTVANWVNEFDIWLRVAKCDSIDIYDLHKFKNMDERRFQLRTWHREGGVMIISYGMYRTLLKKNPKGILLESLVRPGPDVVVCDEGHLLKNEKTALSKTVSNIQTSRRIVLTGTPLQNNLKEYHCMVQFIKPNILGNQHEFANRFVNPIENGQFEDSTPRDVEIMKRRSHVLYTMLSGCIQRQDYNVLTPFLPPKHEYVLAIALSEPLAALYRHYLQTERSGHGRAIHLLGDFQALQRIWTHPLTMQAQLDISNERKAKEKENLDEYESDFIDDGSSKSGSGSGSSSDEGPKRKPKTRSDPRESSPVPEVQQQPPEEKPWWDGMVSEEMMEQEQVSNKLVVFFSILRECVEKGDKLLVFSQSLLTLDLIEHFLCKRNEQGERWKIGLHYFRLDGATTSDRRAQFAKAFNRPDNKTAKLFLISTRAGGLGINLVGANRVVIFDACWNPSHDLQSIFRIYRFGQAKPCFVYRLLAEATMEEKIYERQVTKLSLAHRVVDEHQIERHYTSGNLQELYRFEPTPKEKWKTPIVPKDDVLAKILKSHEDIIVSYHEHDSLLENKHEEELSEEERKRAWEEYEIAQNPPPPPPPPLPSALSGMPPWTLNMRANDAAWLAQLATFHKPAMTANIDKSFLTGLPILQDMLKNNAVNNMISHNVPTESIIDDDDVQVMHVMKKDKTSGQKKRYGSTTVPNPLATAAADAARRQAKIRGELREQLAQMDPNQLLAIGQEHSILPAQGDKKESYIAKLIDYLVASNESSGFHMY